MTIQQLKYTAFISYSHRDTAWAKWFHRALEHFRIDGDLIGRTTETGVIPRTLRPVFRDRDEFTAGQTLNDQTLAALDASGALVVLCSPASAKSPYVNEEVRLFKTRHPERPLIPVIVDGKPGESETECFPAAVRFALDSDGGITGTPVQVIAADVRKTGDGSLLALAKVLARMLGLATDDVFQRARRAEQAAKLRLWTLRTAIGVLAVSLAGVSLGWWHQDFLKTQFYWHTVMSPSYSRSQEQTLGLPNIFQQCAKGCPKMAVPALPPQSALKPFAIGTRHVTAAEWQVCAATNGCPLILPEHTKDDEYGDRIVQVTGIEAAHFIAWLSKMTGEDYRLPTEAEYQLVSPETARLQRAIGKLSGQNYWSNWSTERFPFRVARSIAQ